MNLCGRRQRGVDNRDDDRPAAAPRPAVGLPTAGSLPFPPLLSPRPSTLLGDAATTAALTASFRRAATLTSTPGRRWERRRPQR